MRISDLMSKDAQWIAADATVADAAKAMRERNIGAVPIAADDKLIGMVTDRDIAVRCCADGKTADSTRAADIMSEGVLYCSEEDEAKDVAANMAENHVRRLPVISSDKRLVGIVSLADIASHDQDAATATLEALQTRH